MRDHTLLSFLSPVRLRRWDVSFCLFVFNDIGIQADSTKNLNICWLKRSLRQGENQRTVPLSLEEQMLLFSSYGVLLLLKVPHLYSHGRSLGKRKQPKY
jgi:hypothetical protein